MMRRPSLDALAELLGEPIAQDVRAGQAEVAPLPVPGLPAGTCWTVNIPHEPHLPAVVVGRGPEEALRLLSSRPHEFTSLVDEVGASIDDPGTAIGFVRGYLAATRPPEVLVQVPSTAQDIAWRPGTPDEEARRQDLLATTAIGPRAQRQPDGTLHVSVVVLRDQQAVGAEFVVWPDGRFEVDEHVLADDLPLPILW